jgi:hypothetical protein
MQITKMQSLSEPQGLDVTPRDIEILRGLFECRILTVEQIAALHFQDRQEAARKRLWKLKKTDLVRERPRRAYEPALLFLSRRALHLLIEQGHIADYPKLSIAAYEKRTRVSPLTLRHEIEVNDVKAAFARAIGTANGLELARFSTWPTLIEFWGYTRRGHRVRVQPDGFLRIRHARAEDTFFLEVDRSSETHWRITQRIECYLDFYRRGGLALRNGRSKQDFREFPFRLLIICRTRERRDNIAAAMLLMHPPILTMVWLTTFAELCQNALGSIWIRPVDYRNATVGTEFDPFRTANGAGYKRDTTREEHIEHVVRKLALFSPG